MVDSFNAETRVREGLLATSHDLAVLDQTLDLVCDSLGEVVKDRVRVELIVEFLDIRESTE